MSSGKFQKEKEPAKAPQQPVEVIRPYQLAEEVEGKLLMLQQHAPVLHYGLLVKAYADLIGGSLALMHRITTSAPPSEEGSSDEDAE